MSPNSRESFSLFYSYVTRTSDDSEATQQITETKWIIDAIKMQINSRNKWYTVKKYNFIFNDKQNVAFCWQRNCLWSSKYGLWSFLSTNHLAILIQNTQKFILNSTIIIDWFQLFKDYLSLNQLFIFIAYIEHKGDFNY